MALKAIITEAEFGGLNEAIKAEYKKQSDGSYMLDVTPINDVALENVKGLRSTISATRTERDEANNKLKAFEGLDAAKAREAIKKLEELGDLNKLPTDEKVKQQIDSLKKQLSEKHAGELAGKDGEIQTLTKQLEKVMIESVAIKAITENKGNVEVLLPHVKAATRMKRDDKGNYMVEVVGDDGNVRLTNKTGETGNMTISEFVGTMKQSDTFACAFDGSGASGSGAHSGNRGGNNGGKNPWKKETENLTEQYRIMKENPQLAATLKAQAGVA